MNVARIGVVDREWIGQKKTGRWARFPSKITKGGGSKKKVLGSQGDAATWDVAPEKEPSKPTFA